MDSSPSFPFMETEAIPKPVSKRGRKKHRCSVCGNSAKSRCSFLSCKGCCVKSKNPCHIHVGEAVQSFPEKTSPHPAPSATSLQQSNSCENLRLRTFNPPAIITKKEAAAINNLRFQKLREYREGIVESEDLAFDRYLENSRLLEVIFSGELLEGLSCRGHLLIDGISDSEGVSGLMVNQSLYAGKITRLQTNLKRKEAQRQKLKCVIEHELQSMMKSEHADSILDSGEIYSVYSDVRRDMKRIKVQTIEGKTRLRKMDIFASITEKLRQVESQDDFNSCLKVFEDNFVNIDTLSMNITELVQVPRSQEHGNIEENGSSRSPLRESEKGAMNVGTFNVRRVDSFGVLKSWWKADLFSGSMDFCVNVPTTIL
ncbi:hypothetical protein KP509_12G080500 [Ceratopteris richardii]|uniref:Uncharacterized protein n=1 Tax=Ceratopteris richardii TaxID=49495 RepID=A0A8T2TQD5_CERRI|nr:hypothetical protein KP509_12G080500 [Ceratopteris richardii]